LNKKVNENIRISDLVREQLSNMILSGTFKKGERMPSERLLAEQLKASRPTVRAALSKLEQQGLITRVRGGGTYVSDKVQSSFSDPLVDLFQEKESFKYDMLEYRLAIEEASCYFAAMRATAKEKKMIKEKFDHWIALREDKDNVTNEELAEADLAFHLSIAEASHNIFFPHAMQSAHDIIKKSLTMIFNQWNTPVREEIILEDHTAMLEAILENNPEAAKAAVNRHLNRVKSELEKSDILAMREKNRTLDFGVIHNKNN
jgi:DNA-binding FadR family transcriptional regulator